MRDEFFNLEPPPPPPSLDPPRGSGGRLRLLGIALAIATVGALAGFVVTRAGSSLANTTAASSTPKPSPSAHRPSFGPGDGHGFGCNRGLGSKGFGASASFAGFCGGATGTVTGISGSTITLRTLAGTVTVTTSSATKYSREGRQVTFAAIKVGEVLAVGGSRGATSKTPTSPITATTITIEIPVVSGRVQSVSGNTITLVTGNGQLEYVTTSGATVYQGIRGAAATRSAVKAGIFIVAQGPQTDLTHLSADGVQVLGSTPFAPRGGPGHTNAPPSPRPSGAGSPV